MSPIPPRVDSCDSGTRTITAMTVNTQRKGSGWRRAVVLWFESHGWSAEPRGIGFAGDDIDARRGAITLSVECKNVKRMDLAGWVDQAVANAGPAIPVVVAHRHGRASVEDSYVVMRGSDFIELVSCVDLTSSATLPLTPTRTSSLS